MTTLHLKKSIGRSPLRLALLLIALAFTCFGLSPSTQAQEGGAGDQVNLNNTFEGKNALITLQNNKNNINVGGENTAVGIRALASDLSGKKNTAIGAFTLDANSSGQGNTATGDLALTNNVRGDFNTAVGTGALASNDSGDKNIALGNDAGRSIKLSNNIDIGNVGFANDSGTIRIGDKDQTKTFIAGIHGAMAPNAVMVVVNSSGQLGTLPSSSRFKDDIHSMDKASEAILALKPVTFRYKKELDPKGLPQFGLVAEEVQKVNPDLVARDGKGEIYSVRYEAVNAMLLNEFLKEHRKVEQLTKDFQSKLAEQQKQIEALTTGLQKVSAQVEASKPAPQVVNNP